MQFEDFRNRHQVLHYRSFRIERERGHIRLTFEFELEPGIMFYPNLVVVSQSDVSLKELEPLAFHVGLAELASYWKCACPREIRISAGKLSAAQCDWWYDLLLHGLGEFYFRNQIDFTRPDFLKIHSTADAPELPAPTTFSTAGGCILTAGGKDSSLTLELLREQHDELVPLILNPSRAALESANLAGFSNPIVMRRTIDPTLLALNEQGYLNGHTPFSSYLAFASLFTAAVSGRRDLIVSNEKSANQENVVFHDLPINHQYSKSYRFETKFRHYVDSHLSPSFNYFSILRPLYDLQVAGLFAKNCTAHFRSFRSCNVGSRKDIWCGTCPKCAFTYLALAAFVSEEMLLQIWGQDITRHPEFEKQVRGLIGIDPIKPFECVGTIEESIQALRRAITCATQHGRDPNPVLVKLAAQTANVQFDELTISEISNEHCLPEEYLNVIEDAVYLGLSNEQ